VPAEPPPGVIEAAVAVALAEDRAAEDATTLATVPPGLTGVAAFVAREAGILAGVPVVRETFRQLSARVAVEELRADGEAFGPGDTVLVARGPVQALLQGERTALNFLQRLSGIATLARAFVDAVEGTGAVILDTRKTTPGLRALEKYAVRCGGATNHRRDLATMAMIKDNHREALARAGRSLADGVAAIRRRTPGIPVEVEVDSLDDLEAALEGAPEWVLLDNMSIDQLREAVSRNAGRARLEASGGIRLENARAIALTGVDAMSVGALTHSARALDIGLDLTF
jgi:nicotinate-nucleotide pyrophosphorylase (carboxylating)